MASINSEDVNHSKNQNEQYSDEDEPQTPTQTTPAATPNNLANQNSSQNSSKIINNESLYSTSGKHEQTSIEKNEPKNESSFQRDERLARELQQKLDSEATEQSRKDEQLARKLQQELVIPANKDQQQTTPTTRPARDRTSTIMHSNVDVSKRLEDQTWYVPSVDRKAAEDLLFQCDEDTFLVRNSSLKASFATSFFTYELQKVTHTLITYLEYGPGYYQMQDNARMYSSVVDLVSKAPEFRAFKPYNSRRDPTRPRMATLTDKGAIVNNNSGNAILNSSNNYSPQAKRQSDHVNASMNLSTNLTAPVVIRKKPTMSLDVDTVCKMAEKAMTQRTSQMEANDIKEALKTVISEYSDRVKEYDMQLVQMSLRNKSEVKLPESEHTKYVETMQLLERLKGLLFDLRMRGDEFRILTKKKESKVFKITAESQIIFCNIKRTTSPQDIAPTDMTQFQYFNVRVLETTGSPLYEVTFSHGIHYIDQIDRIIADDSVVVGNRRGGICVRWKNTKTTTFLCAVPGEQEELLEVLQAHLQRFKQSAIRQIQLLKDIWKCKLTKFDSINREHVALLERLWQVILPEEKTPPQVSEQWKRLGFQGKDPSTDFRGMGLLGLLNLVYFAENYPRVVQLQVNSKRDYPWAATGINITQMLLNMLKLSNELVNQAVPEANWMNPLLTLFYYADNDDTFDELYCQSFILFDKLWLHIHAEYMDFPYVLRRVQTIIQDLLMRKPLDLKQLVAWIIQSQLAYSTRL